MTLEELPIVSEETFEAHWARLRSSERYAEFIKETVGYLLKYNLSLARYLASESQGSSDPEGILRTAYTVLSLINEQLSAKRLDREVSNSPKS